MQFKQISQTLVMSSLVMALLGGCGGGGDSGDTALTPSSASKSAAEGLWRGTTSDGLSITAAVLENGELWALGSSSTGVVGFYHGDLYSSGNNLYGSGTTYGLISHRAIPSTFSGMAYPQNSLNLTVGSTVFHASYASDYDQSPAPLTSMAGTYSGWVATVSGSYDPSAVISISATGQIASGGTYCSVLGNITPRASGKNVYDVTITYNGTNCSVAGTTLTGMAAYDSNSGVLVVLALTGSKADGLIYSATKQPI